MIDKAAELGLDVLCGVLHGVSEDDYVVFGSTVLYLYGLRPSVGDIDLLVTARVYHSLRGLRHIQELWPRAGDPPLLELAGAGHVPLHIFYAWTHRDTWFDVPACFALAERMHGFSCIPLELVAQHKREAYAANRHMRGAAQEKHLRDLAVLAERGL